MQMGLWDESLRLEKLSKLGDSLERLNRAIDWEVFRPKLTTVHYYLFTAGICPTNYNFSHSSQIGVPVLGQIANWIPFFFLS